MATNDVARAQKRDAEAFRRLYLATADRVHRLARWLLQSADVDDVMQDIYVHVWEELPKLRDLRAFNGWLRQVAVSVILRRRERSVRTSQLEDAVAATTPTLAREAPPGLRIDLERAVSRLPAKARDVFVLYDVQGHDHLEIAQLLGISHHTSRSQLHRARGLLRNILEESE